MLQLCDLFSRVLRCLGVFCILLKCYGKISNSFGQEGVRGGRNGKRPGVPLILKNVLETGNGASIQSEKNVLGTGKSFRQEAPGGIFGHSCVVAAVFRAVGSVKFANFP
jgi:hypothetical protein